MVYQVITILDEEINLFMFCRVGKSQAMSPHFRNIQQTEVSLVFRQGIKEYSSWPTIPQVYVNGEFVGGSDILIELYQKGELQEMVEVALAS